MYRIRMASVIFIHILFGNPNNMKFITEKKSKVISNGEFFIRFVKQQYVTENKKEIEFLE